MVNTSDEFKGKMEETTFVADPMRLMIVAAVGIVVLLVLDYSDLPCMELLDDELGYYMDCMAGCRCFVCSIAWCGENGVKEWQ